MSYTQFQYQRNKDGTCKIEAILYKDQCLRFKKQGLCKTVTDDKRDLTTFCKSTCGFCGTHILLLISLIFIQYYDNSLLSHYTIFVIRNYCNSRLTSH